MRSYIFSYKEIVYSSFVISRRAYRKKVHGSNTCSADGLHVIESTNQVARAVNGLCPYNRNNLINLNEGSKFSRNVGIKNIYQQNIYHKYY